MREAGGRSEGEGGGGGGLTNGDHDLNEMSSE